VIFIQYLQQAICLIISGVSSIWRGFVSFIIRTLFSDKIRRQMNNKRPPNAGSPKLLIEGNPAVLALINPAL
jgi:hypothetical protein